MSKRRGESIRLPSGMPVFTTHDEHDDEWQAFLKREGRPANFKYYYPSQPKIIAGDRIHTATKGAGTVLGLIASHRVLVYGSSVIVQWDDDPPGELAYIGLMVYTVINA